jgi:hypothetical protein
MFVNIDKLTNFATVVIIIWFELEMNKHIRAFRYEFTRFSLIISCARQLMEIRRKIKPDDPAEQREKRREKSCLIDIVLRLD